MALKSKTGELEALSQTRASVIPMVELLDSLPADERRQVIRDLVMCVAERARARQPTWIDISWLSAASELAAFPHGVFHELERRIDNALGLDSQIIDAPRFVPVVPISVSERQLARIRLLWESGKSELGVRAFPARHRDAIRLVARIRTIAMATRMPIPAIHVILDQLYVERADAEAVMGLVAVIEVMRSSLPLASITLLGGSIPRKRTTSQTHIRGRPEWEWWNAVCAQIDVP
ncbi:MAG: beta family protein, partial [Sciscionella sp.]